MGFCEYGESAGKKNNGNGVFSGVLAVAFGIPLGLQGKSLTTVQLASSAFPHHIKALSSRHWPSTAEA